MRKHACQPRDELLTYLFSEVVDGRNADTTDGVRRALGREAGLRAHARSGGHRVWTLRRPADEARGTVAAG